MKENQLLLKDLLELWKIKSTDMICDCNIKNGYIDKVNDIVDSFVFAKMGLVFLRIKI